MNKPHDLFFKETFSNLAVARSFIENFLPTEVLKAVDLGSLQAQKDSFIHKSLRESHLIALQLLRYMVDIWDTKTLKAKSPVIPIVIPLVVYQGDQSWDLVKSLSGLMPQYNGLSESLKKYIPNFEFLLYDISGIPLEDAKLEVQLKLALAIIQALQDVNPKRTREAIEDAIKALHRLEDQTTATAYLETYMKYVFSVSHNLDVGDFNHILH